MHTSMYEILQLHKKLFRRMNFFVSQTQRQHPEEKLDFTSMADVAKQNNRAQLNTKWYCWRTFSRDCPLPTPMILMYSYKKNLHELTCRMYSTVFSCFFISVWKILSVSLLPRCARLVVMSSLLTASLKSCSSVRRCAFIWSTLLIIVRMLDRLTSTLSSISVNND